MWTEPVSFFFLLSLSGVSTKNQRSKGPSPSPSVNSTDVVYPCWYGGQCKYDYRDRKMVIDAPYVSTLEAQMEWCYLKCSRDKVCKHFNVHMVRGKPFCYLLKECKQLSITDACVLHGKCNSGPKNCTSNTSWVDSNGAQVIVVSKCIGGIWSTSTILPETILASDVPALPKRLPQPDVAQDQVSCGCADYDMAWNGTIDYDPNKLPGTAFTCTGGNPITDDGTHYKFILKPDMTCRLFCDSYHVTTMACINGQWTGNPEHGAWCYKQPSEDDDMGEVSGHQ